MMALHHVNDRRKVVSAISGTTVGTLTNTLSVQL